MTPQEFQAVYPILIDWIRQTLAECLSQTKTVASAGFKLLPLYFNSALLVSAKFVVVDQVPVPPLSALGLSRFAEFEQGNYDGITYLDTFFVRRQCATDEKLFFHELIHVAQWDLLGPELFLSTYADGLEKVGYHNCPLEVMAYTAQELFSNSVQPFDAKQFVKEQLKNLIK